MPDGAVSEFAFETIAIARSSALEETAKVAENQFYHEPGSGTYGDVVGATAGKSIAAAIRALKEKT